MTKNNSPIARLNGLNRDLELIDLALTLVLERNAFAGQLLDGLVDAFENTKTKLEREISEWDEVIREARSE